MKFLKIFIILLVSFTSVGLYSKDSSFVSGSRFRIGIKFMTEKSRNHLVAFDEMEVYNGGIQVIRKIGHSDFSFESGLYLITRAIVDGPFTSSTFTKTTTFSILYRNISVPLNCRYDKRFFYISAGPFFDYLFKEDLSKWMDPDTGLNPRKFNVGVNLNLGITLFRKKDLNVFLEVRYSKNLTSILKAEKNIQWINFTNTGLAFGLNYALH